MLNRKRQLAVLSLLKKYSDPDDHYLNAGEIIALLKEEYELEVREVKTIYADIKALKEMGFEIISEKKGSYLVNTPFKLSEIKILKDLIAGLKTIDPKDRSNLLKKLDSFISIYDQKFLKTENTAFDNKSRPYIFEKILEALKRHEYLIYKDSLIIPYKLILENNYYYLYYVYPKRPKRFYALRLDHIKDLENSDLRHDLELDYGALETHIKKRVRSFMGEEVMVTLKIQSADKYILESLKDDFKDLIIKKGSKTEAYLFTSLSDQFFASIARYKNAVIITKPLKAKEEYIAFLNSILKEY